ncbi:PIG-L deacetylase family protein [Paenibacillus sp. 2TAB23]|uniref:PIG-L deacetylase family protein n=1 Tax=Paenibacillus sp. 2TAB23 TaxID=3233004 RepID=UPI003F95AFAC
MTDHQYLFISPHLDDAILSCGDYIDYLYQCGHRIVIATVFTGEDTNPSPSPLAKILHKRFNLRFGVMEARLNEDQQAAAVLGASCIHLNLQECIYRRNSDNSPSYQKLDELFRADLSLEQPVIERVEAQLSRTLDLMDYIQVYIPIGIGRHVDHGIVRQAAECWAWNTSACEANQIAYYEDLPYKHYHTDPNWHKELAANLERQTVQLSRASMRAKLWAVDHYKSQHRLLWKSRIAMLRQMLANTRGYDESAAIDLDNQSYRFTYYTLKALPRSLESGRGLK